jgi:hypothetical protein
MAQTDTHHSPAKSGKGYGVFDGSLVILSEITLKPPDTLAANNNVRINYLIKTFFVGDMPADNDLGCGLMLPDQLAHLFDLADIRENRADTDNVVGPMVDFFTETIKRGKIHECAGRFQISLNHHQTERAVKHAQGKSTLNPGYLIFIKFHRVDLPASVFVIPGIGSKDTRQQNSGFDSEWMDWLIMIEHDKFSLYPFYRRATVEGWLQVSGSH